jgi:hypothetical protein
MVAKQLMFKLEYFVCKMPIGRILLGTGCRCVKKYGNSCVIGIGGECGQKGRMPGMNSLARLSLTRTHSILSVRSR